MLHDRHAAAARALARRLVRGEEEVDDVVAEAFTRILDLVGRGGGPGDAFRTYLLTVVRRTVHDRARIESRQVTPDDPFDPAVPFVDPALAGLERSMLARAFLSLPERWRAVLWHVEVERAEPADVAPLLGLSRDELSPLAYQAREGLRQAYVRLYLSASPDPACVPVLGRMVAHVRGGLSRRDSRTVTAHARGCARCRAVLTELTDISAGLRVVVGPLLAGPAFPEYAADLSQGPASRGAAGSSMSALLRVTVTPSPEETAPFPQPVRRADAEHVDEEVLFWGTDGFWAADGDTADTEEAEEEDLAFWESEADRAEAERRARREGGGAPEDGAGSTGAHGNGSEGGRAGGGAGGGGSGAGGAGDDGFGAGGADAGDGEWEAGACGARRSPRLVGWLQRVAASRRVAVAGGAAVAVAAATTFAVASGRLTVDRLATSPMAHPLGSDRSPLTVVEPDPVSPPGPEPGDMTGGGRARLRATIDPLGAMVRGRSGIVAIRLRNSGRGPSAGVRAMVDLPVGITMMPPGSRGHGAVLGPATTPPRRTPPHDAPSPKEGTPARGGTTPGPDAATRRDPASGGDAASPRDPASGRDALSPRDPASPRDASPDLGALLGRGALPGLDSSPGPGTTPDLGTGATPGRAGASGGAEAEGGEGTSTRRHRHGTGSPASPRRSEAALARWTCRAVPEGARCARSPLRAGESTVLLLRVQVAADARDGAAPAVRVRAGRVRTAARAATGVRPAGAPARFATEGRVSVMAIGNSLLTCPGGQTGCAAARRREGARRDNDLWSMVPLDADRVGSTAASSAARLRMPRGGRIVWAGLYWSAGGSAPGPIRVRPPGHRRYEPVRPDEVEGARLPSGPAYQAFADVTGLVAASRREGEWWAADAPMEPGVSRHAGWSLVVIATDPARPYTRTVVLDGAVATGGGSAPLRLPLDGLAPGRTPDETPGAASDETLGATSGESLGATSGETPGAASGESAVGTPGAASGESAGESSGGTTPGRTTGRTSGLTASGRTEARVRLVTWEGDAELDGDTVSAGGGPLVPEGGDRDAANPFDGSTGGAAGMTFGVDVDTFETDLRDDPALTITSEKDAILFGIAAVSTRTRQ
ncbi:sigma-70 family RNA polymerase sigma factor [Nonomuraea sp. RK-328]|nr:sigma-70 family RNA polymerase sigma factor [Nonomuraea sp. RK-328]